MLESLGQVLKEVIEALSASAGGILEAGSDRLLIIEILRESGRMDEGGIGVVEREAGPGVSGKGVEAP